MTDWITKGILLLIAAGIWMNVLAVGELSDRFALLDGWFINGSPVRVTQTPTNP